jgi:hypothetical protein
MAIGIHCAALKVNRKQALLWDHVRKPVTRKNARHLAFITQVSIPFWTEFVRRSALTSDL